MKKIDKLDKKNKKAPERLYTVSEVAEILEMTDQTVRKKIELGIIEAEINTKPFLIPHCALYNEHKSPFNIFMSFAIFLIFDITHINLR